METTTPRKKARYKVQPPEGCYTVESTSEKIGKSPQTVRAYVKRGYLKLSPLSTIEFWITGASIQSLQTRLAGRLGELRKERSDYMRNTWKKLKRA